MPIEMNNIIKKHFPLKKHHSIIDLENILKAYSTYGMYYLIVPFIEEVHIFCEEKTSKRLDKIIALLPDALFIQTTVQNYHQKILTTFERFSSHQTMPEQIAWTLTMSKSRAQMNAMVWESYDLSQLSNISNSITKNVGLWTPGLYSDNVDKSFLDKLSSMCFSAIDKVIKHHRENYTADSWIPDIIDEQLQLITSELNFQYLSAIQRAEHIFFHINLPDFQHLSSTELLSRLFSDKERTNLYFTFHRSWVEALEKLCKINESWFGLEGQTKTECLNQIIPFLYQLINLEKEAEENLVNQLLKREKSHSASLLMSCTIALAKTRDDTVRNKIASYLEDMYSINSNSECVNEYLSLLDEVVDFYTIYFERIRQYCETQDCMYHEKMLHRLREDLQSSCGIIGDASLFWMYQNLIRDDSFICSLRMCKENIRAALNPTIDAHDFFELAMRLFSLVSSHIEAEPRIIGNQLLEIISKREIPNLNYEVFYSADFYDNARHQTLYNRFVVLHNELPNRLFTSWARDIIHEYCQGDAVIVHELVSACSKICDNPTDYHPVIEDRNNRAICDLLEASLKHYGYSICGQKEHGLGKTGNKPGRLDILIQKAGLPIAIYEGLLYRGENYLIEHIEKTFTRYNYSGCKKVYMVEFIETNSYRKSWESSMGTLRKYPGIHIDEKDTGLNGVRMGVGTFQWNTHYTGKLIFIGVNCGVER